MIHNKIAELCYSVYSTLGKNGKPAANEWTNLSAILIEQNETLSVVSLATGTKCIGKHLLSQAGDIVNDSHAEVLARRGFLRYVYDQILKSLENELSIFTNLDNNKFTLIKGIKFHFYTSHVPCGDASIILKRKIDDLSDCDVKSKKLKSDDNDVGKQIIHDIYRTGAKCLIDDDRQDKRESGLDYHVVGAVRTKPGRGDPTLSVSCSDKIAKWLFVGLQGSLLSLFLENCINLDSIIIGGGSQFCEKAMTRALVTRSKLLQEKIPKIFLSDLIFQKSKSLLQYQNARPCPTSIVYCLTKEKPLEVLVEGRLHGLTKNHQKKILPKITKKELFKNFINISKKIGKNYDNKNYGEIKKLASNYLKCFEDFKTNMKAWTKKPGNLEDFNI